MGNWGLVQRWRDRAKTLDHDNELVLNGRYYSGLSDEERTTYNRNAALASAYRQCAKELEGIVRREPD